MKKTWILLALAACAATADAKTLPSNSALFLGARHHADSELSMNLPYEEGDLSYVAGFDWYTGRMTRWQLLASYLPETTDPAVDYLLTPQLNVLAYEKGFLVGTGVLMSYLPESDEPLPPGAEERDEWTDPYFQLMTGLSFPIGKANLTLLAVYPFEELDEIRDFEFDKLEYQAGLSLRF